MKNSIKENLEEKYTLVYVDRNDDLSGYLNVLNQVFTGEKEFYVLEELANSFYEEQINSNLKMHRKNLLEKMLDKYPKLKKEIKIYFQENEEYIENLILEKDYSNVLEDLLKNTGDLPIRIQLQSNYDCLNSPYYEGYQYETEGSYFADVIEALGLNHQKVKREMKEYDLSLVGEQNHKKNKEIADEKEIVEELINMTCGACLLTITARLNAKDLLKYLNPGEIKSIIIPKENLLGFYSSWQGGGSIFDATLKNNLELFPKDDDRTMFMAKHAIKKEDKYFYFSLSIDGGSKYSLKDTYGVTNEFFGNSIEINIEQQGEKK